MCRGLMCRVMRQEANGGANYLLPSHVFAIFWQAASTNVLLLRAPSKSPVRAFLCFPSQHYAHEHIQNERPQIRGAKMGSEERGCGMSGMNCVPSSEERNKHGEGGIGVKKEMREEGQMMRCGQHTIWTANSR